MPNPMMKVWMTEHGPVEMRLGHVVTFNKKAAVRGIAPAGAKAELGFWHNDYSSLVGMIALDPEYIDGWGDLDGEVDNERGWWMEMEELIAISNINVKGDMVVSKNHKFKDIELKDMECTLLSYIDNTKLAFVEFDKNIGGCSADGLGRRGHCIAVPTNILQMAKTAKA